MVLLRTQDILSLMAESGYLPTTKAGSFLPHCSRAWGQVHLSGEETPNDSHPTAMPQTRPGAHNAGGQLDTRWVMCLDSGRGLVPECLSCCCVSSWCCLLQNPYKPHRTSQTFSCTHPYAHACIDMHALTGTQPHVHTRLDTHTGTQPHVHTRLDTHTHRHTATRAYTHMDTHILTGTQPHVHTHTWTHTYSQAHSHTCIHTHGHTYTHRHTATCACTPGHTHTHRHTATRAHTHGQAHLLATLMSSTSGMHSFAWQFHS